MDAFVRRNIIIYVMVGWLSRNHLSAQMSMYAIV